MRYGGSHTYVQDRAVPVHCCRAADWAPPSDAAEKEDGLRLCMVLLGIKSDVMLHVFFVILLDVAHTLSTFLQDRDMRITATAALATTTASPCSEKKR